MAENHPQVRNRLSFYVPGKGERRLRSGKKISFAGCRRIGAMERARKGNWSVDSPGIIPAIQAGASLTVEPDTR